MAAPCRIRPATTADATDLAALERALFSDPWPAAAFRPGGAGETCLVAEAEGALVGYAVVRIVADEAEVLNLAVRADQRRRGIARALLRAALAEAGAAGVRQVFLEVREGNAAARAFYEREGFHATGRRRAYYRKPPEDAVVMRRAL